MNTKNTTKYTLAGLGLTVGLAIAAARRLTPPVWGPPRWQPGGPHHPLNNQRTK